MRGGDVGVDLRVPEISQIRMVQVGMPILPIPGDVGVYPWFSDDGDAQPDDWPSLRDTSVGVDDGF